MSPIPVITDHYLAQVVMFPDSAALENSFVNTWFFRNDAALLPHDGVADNITEVLDAFYNADNNGAGTKLSRNLSPVINITTAQIRVYDLGVAAPRTPIVKVLTLDAPLAGNPLPNECAAVLSYRSGAAGSGGGTINRRARGRLYIGPLNVNSQLAYASPAPDARLATSFIDALAASAENVLNTTQDVTWRQYSRAANLMQDVTGGFVNNSFDTQRRRGAISTSRTVWP